MSCSVLKSLDDMQVRRPRLMPYSLDKVLALMQHSKLAFNIWCGSLAGAVNARS